MGTVHAARGLVAAAAQIGHDVAAADPDPDVDPGLLFAAPVAVEAIARVVVPVGELVDARPRHPFGPGDDFGHRHLQRVEAVAGDQLFQTALGGLAGGVLRAQVAEADRPVADVRQDHFEHAGIGPAAFEQLYRRDEDAFLVDIGGRRRVAARTHAADIRPVPAVAGISVNLTPMEHRPRDQHVGQMRAADERVVGGEDVSRKQVLPADRRHRALQLQRHGRDMDGKAVGVLGDDLARAVHHAAGQIALFLPKLGIGRAHGHDLHVARYRDQRAVDRGKGEGIDGGGVHSGSCKVTIKLPCGSTATLIPSSTSVVDEGSSTMAGPSQELPGAIRSRR